MTAGRTDVTAGRTDVTADAIFPTPGILPRSEGTLPRPILPSKPPINRRFRSVEARLLTINSPSCFDAFSSAFSRGLAF